jgi:hypothetical protein
MPKATCGSCSGRGNHGPKEEPKTNGSGKGQR